MSGYQQEHFPIPTPGHLRRELHLRRPPRWLVLLGLALLATVALLLAVIFHFRSRPSPRPRIHLIQDMGVQPRYGPQAVSPVFADGRAMRLPVAGTVARGQLASDQGLSALWPEQLPRGRVVYQVFCTPCHGERGDGEGPVNQRALLNKEPTWVAAPSLLTPAMQALDDVQIYNTIRLGNRNMPPHGTQINVRDRWAAVAYLRDLQQRQEPEPTAAALPTR